MILQLQLEVLDFTHSLKRTIELHEGSTFEDLGNVILALFNYDDDGGASFVFEVAKSNGKMGTGYIGADFGDDFSIAEEDMHDDEDEILSDWPSLFAKAEELKCLRPWLYLGDHQIIAAEHVATEMTLFISVMGATNLDYGLAIYMDAPGRAMLEKMQLGEPESDFYLEMESLNVAFVDRADLSKEDYALIKSLGLSYRGKKNWIQFRSFMPGLFPWQPNGEQAEIILYAMQQVIDVIAQIKQGWEFPELDIHEYYFRTVDRDLVTVGEEIITFDDSLVEPYPIFVELSEFEWKQLEKKAMIPLELEFDLLYVPQAETGERPYYPLFIIAMDRATGEIIYQEVVPMMRDGLLAQATFVDMIKNLPSKPAVCGRGNV